MANQVTILYHRFPDSEAPNDTKRRWARKRRQYNLVYIKNMVAIMIPGRIHTYRTTRSEALTSRNKIDQESDLVRREHDAPISPYHATPKPIEAQVMERSHGRAQVRILCASSHAENLFWSVRTK